MKTQQRSLSQMLGTALVLSIGMVVSITAKASVLVPAEVTNLFVPNGFDDNDEIVVAMDGYLPDPCHVMRQPEVAIDKVKRVVKVSPMAELVSGACPDVIVPYQIVARIGVLGAGPYSIETLRGGKRETLSVKVASNPGPDDYLYAPVDSASVSRRLGGGMSATIKGRLTNTCLDFQDVRVIDSGRSFEVLPILRMSSQDPQGGQCRAVERAFEKVVDLPEHKTGRYLLHVRSMNGQSVNEIFQTYW